jgi:hypothetical protein
MTPDVLWMVGWCLAYLAGETTAGTSLIERGLALNPNCAQAFLASAHVNCFACHNDAAIQALERVARLSPLDPLGYQVKFAFALAKIQKPGFINAMVVRTAACGDLDLREEGANGSAGSVRSPHSDTRPRGPSGSTMSVLGVRRAKAALSSGCKSHPATAPAGSNRSSHGGNEVAEAFD